jgi:hypothetical protein
MGINSDEKKGIELSGINKNAVVLKTKDGEKCLELQQEIQEKHEFKPADGGIRAWLVCAATVWAFGINLGLEYNFTLIHNEFTVVYNETENSVVYAGIKKNKTNPMTLLIPNLYFIN